MATGHDPIEHGLTDEQIDAEIAEHLTDSQLRADLEKADADIDSGDYVAVPHDEVKRILGLDQPGQQVAHG